MQKPLRYKANNWVDGMKLSSAHFVATDQYIQDLIRDTASLSLNDHNYGLLPPFVGNRMSFDIQILTKATNYIEVHVKSCNAVAADGARIDIDTAVGMPDIVLNQYIDTKDLTLSKHYITLFVNLFKRTPTGEPDPDETPVRYPQVSKAYSIALIAESELQESTQVSHFLPIGQLVQEGNNTILNTNYIMPSSTLGCHPRLIDWHNQWYSGLVQLQTAAFKIMEKTAVKDKITNLGVNIRMISEKMLQHLAMTFFDYRNILPSQSPLFLVKYFSDLAHVFFNAIKIMPGQDREEMLKYFYEWRDVTPSNFEERLANAIEQHYNHLEIQQSMDTIQEFMQVMVALWEKLATLEYIGQRRENIVVAEQKVVQEVQTKRTWSLLD